jgi:hypothetical protein
MACTDPEELLERLARVMGGGGLRQWQTGGRLDPFGSTTSEAWARWVCSSGLWCLGSTQNRGLSSVSGSMGQVASGAGGQAYELG